MGCWKNYAMKKNLRFLEFRFVLSCFSWFRALKRASISSILKFKINLYFFLMKRKHLLSDSVICARSSWPAHLFTRRESSRQDGELTKEDHGAQFTKKKTNHTSEIWVPTVTAKVLNPHLHPSEAGIIHLDEAFGHFERAVGLWPTLGPPDLQQGVVNALWRYPGGRNSSMSFPMMVSLSDF